MTGYWNGARPFPSDTLEAVASTLSTSVDWLISGDREIGDRLRRELRAAFSANQDTASESVELQEIDLAYGLGGTYSDGPVEVETHRFPRAWLEKITTSPASALVIARGRGDSMQPTILDGDMVMIDRSQRSIREQDAIWALTVGEIAMIKRIRVRGARVVIQSDNDRVSDDDVHHEEVNVVGRVIFIGRRV